MFIITAIISFVGLIIGVFLTNSNKDELKPGRKYFILFQKIIWALIISISSLAYNLPSWASVVILIFTVLPFLDEKQISAPSMYLFLGVILYLSSKSINLMAINASLIFLFGLPTGTLEMIDEDGKIKGKFIKEILMNLGFFICVPLFILL